jgi:hypothetical protein
MENTNQDWDLDLFAATEVSLEDLPDSLAAGWSTGACVSSGGTAGSTFSSFGSLSSIN